MRIPAHWPFIVEDHFFHCLLHHRIFLITYAHLIRIKGRSFNYLLLKKILHTRKKNFLYLILQCRVLESLTYKKRDYFAINYISVII